jgi:hypothetical protein
MSNRALNYSKRPMKHLNCGRIAADWRPSPLVRDMDRDTSGDLMPARCISAWVTEQGHLRREVYPQQERPVPVAYRRSLHPETRRRAASDLACRFVAATMGFDLPPPAGTLKTLTMRGLSTEDCRNAVEG